MERGLKLVRDNMEKWSKVSRSHFAGGNFAPSLCQIDPFGGPNRAPVNSELEMGRQKAERSNQKSSAIAIDCHRYDTIFGVDIYIEQVSERHLLADGPT